MNLGITRSFCLACVLAAGRELPGIAGSAARHMPLLVAPFGFTEELFSAELHAAQILEPASTADVGRAGACHVVVLNSRPWILRNSRPDLDRRLPELLLWLRFRLQDDEGRRELATLWRILGHGEVLSYLAADLVDHQFDREWSGYAVDVLATGLAKYSAAKMFYLCHLAVRDLASLYLRRVSAAESLPTALLGFIGRRVDGAYAEEWKTVFRRHRRQEESAAAVLFTELITPLGPDYLRRLPSEDLLINEPLVVGPKGARPKSKLRSPRTSSPAR